MCVTDGNINITTRLKRNHYGFRAAVITALQQPQPLHLTVCAAKENPNELPFHCYVGWVYPGSTTHIEQHRMPAMRLYCEDRATWKSQTKMHLHRINRNKYMINHWIII